MQKWALQSADLVNDSGIRTADPMPTSLRLRTYRLAVSDMIDGPQPRQVVHSRRAAPEADDQGQTPSSTGERHAARVVRVSGSPSASAAGLRGRCDIADEMLCGSVEEWE